MIKNQGANNKIILFNNEREFEVKYIPNLTVNFYGSNCTIRLHENVRFATETTISCSNDNFISIDDTKGELNIIITSIMSPGSKLIIGKNFSCGLTEFRLHVEPNLTITIGDDCMFSRNIFLKPSDGHTIFDANTNEILNRPEDIRIEDHVWLGRNVCVLKGSRIPKNSMVALGSVFIKKSLPNDTALAKTGGLIFAGIPAKVKKEGINWDKKHTYEYEQMDNYNNEI